MNRLAIAAVGLVLVLALVTAAVFAIWPVVGDAPWESETTSSHPSTYPSTLPLPSPSQKETEKIACLQGGGNWIYAANSAFCGPGGAACWYCYHPVQPRG
jgi:hypothetical protein